MEHETLITSCSTCKGNTSQTVRVVYDHDANDGCHEQYSLASCDVCQDVALYYREDPEEGAPLSAEPTMWWEVVHRLWPPPKRYIGFPVPDSINKAYNEAVLAVDANLPMAASVMVGRALEEVCKKYQPDSHGIFDGLRKMVDSGALSTEMHEWADSIRVLRNAGAHATDKKFSLQEVEESLDFLQAILMIIFEVRPKFENYKRRSE